MQFEDGGLLVRILQDDDAFILCRWLNNPAVLAFYDGRDRVYDIDMIRAKFFDDTRANRPLGHLVLWQDTPLGYIQTYLVGAREREIYGYSSELSKVYGMDLFLGEPDRWNQGIGTTLVRSVANQLFREYHAAAVVVDPRTDNLRAVHVYEKCGFAKLKLMQGHEWHEGQYRDCWIMEWKPSSVAKERRRPTP